MDFRKKPAKKIVASAFVFLMLFALLATGASAADQDRDQKKLQDGSCTDSDCEQTRDKVRDGSCQETNTATVFTSACDCDQTQDKDQTRERLKDGTCQVSMASNGNGDCDQTQDKDQTQDQLRDGSCPE